MKPARTGAAQRIVSLVPSITETVFAVGKGDHLVGRTRYCVEPRMQVDAVEVVGGTKNPDIAKIVGLQPDLVLVNCEENRREDFDRLIEAGLSVHVTHPRTVVEAVEMIAELGSVLGAETATANLVARCIAALERAERARVKRPVLRVFCPIWRNPWMTFTGATYVSSVLAACGMENVFSNAAEKDFFEVTLERAAAAVPQFVVLPDEPYAFGPRHGRELQAAGIDAAYECIDGKDLAWYGPRLPDALDRLRGTAERVAAPSGA